MNRSNRKQWLFPLLAVLVIAVVGVATAVAGGAQVTGGDFSTFAAGPGLGYEITGHAQMVRTADGRTLTHIQVWGLDAGETYPAHVHHLPCDVNNGGGHYQHEVGGPADDVNEIWPGFTADASGHGNGYAANDFTARPEAQSVVIHDYKPGAARIACADLQ